MFMDPALETADPAVLDQEGEPTIGEQVSYMSVEDISSSG
jgi:hypothetical protein